MSHKMRAGAQHPDISVRQEKLVVNQSDGQAVYVSQFIDMPNGVVGRIRRHLQ
jgi:hypothetical protein